MTPEEFSDICRQYLDLHGSRLDAHSATPCLAVVPTPEGNHYIKYTSTFFSVSTAGYGSDGGPRLIYWFGRGATTASSWLPDEATKLLPHIKRRLVLELLADL
jgi:hypothetical protein